MEICVKYLVFIFLFFFVLVFNHNVIIYIGFTHIACSNAATDVTNCVTDTILNTNI